jgi:hypothetical protein
VNFKYHHRTFIDAPASCRAVPLRIGSHRRGAKEDTRRATSPSWRPSRRDCELERTGEPARVGAEIGATPFFVRPPTKLRESSSCDSNEGRRHLPRGLFANVASSVVVSISANYHPSFALGIDASTAAARQSVGRSEIGLVVKAFLTIFAKLLEMGCSKGTAGARRSLGVRGFVGRQGSGWRLWTFLVSSLSMVVIWRIVAAAAG